MQANRNRIPLSPIVADAVREIKANFGPRRAMTFNRMREWGGAEVKSNGETWLVLSDGRIKRASE